MSHIQRRRRGRITQWVARYRDPSGHEKSRTFRRRADAETFLAATESSKIHGTYVDPIGAKMLLDEWASQWLRSVAPTLKPKTVASYESLLRSRISPRLGGFRLGAIRPLEVQSWVSAMESEGVSSSRIRQAHSILHAVMDAAVRDQRLGRNPAVGVRLPKIQRREARFFNPSEVEMIAAAVPSEYAALITVQGTLGLRFGEAVALRRQSVDLLHRRLRVEESLAEISGTLQFGPTKSHAARTVPIPASVHRTLEVHLATCVAAAPESLLFTSARGYPIRHSRFRPTIWVPTLRNLGIEYCGLHALRHSAAARMIGAGWSPVAVQRVMGHASAAFTLTFYGHLFEDDLDELAARLEAPRHKTPVLALR